MFQTRMWTMRLARHGKRVSRPSRAAATARVAGAGDNGPGPSSRSAADAYRALMREHFERTAGDRERWERINRYYYRDLETFYQQVVPAGARVLEIGAGTGDLLAALRPARGVGIDLSPTVVRCAQERHPELTFLEMDVERLDLVETFDYVIMSGTTGLLADIQQTFTQLQRVCTPRTRLVITYYNYLWEPILRLGEATGQRMPQPAQNWLSRDDIANLLQLTGYRVVKEGQRMLLPRVVPLISGILNRYVAHLPIVDHLCLTGYLIARPDPLAAPRAALATYTCSVIVPARNERGNIEAAMRRMPRMGRHTEIIFVEGHSTDGTFEEIQRVARAYGSDWDIKMLKQDGTGKADAVRKGFSVATGDVLLILDADLTVPPEDLPKFFEVIASGLGELANGCRLIYPRSRKAMPLANTLANKAFGTAFSYLLGQPIKDTLCGTKALWNEDYQQLVANRGYFGDFDPFGDFDLLFGASKLNYDIVEVPVRYLLTCCLVRG
jgi:SAM-dependent methyltransferase